MNHVSKHRYPLFSSTIRFVEQPEFDRITGQMGDKITEDRSNNIGLFKKAYTKHVLSCTAGGVTRQRDDQFLFFHFFHWFASAEHLRDLSKKLVEMGDKMEKARALLIGGVSTSPDSVMLGQELRRFLQDLQLPVSLFWGQNPYRHTGMSNVAYDTEKDTWYVRAVRDGEPKHYREEVTSLDDLVKAFDEIRLAPGDQLVVGGKTYTAETFNRIYPKLRSELRGAQP
jgi:hypothetical protein